MLGDKIPKAKSCDELLYPLYRAADMQSKAQSFGTESVDYLAQHHHFTAENTKMHGVKRTTQSLWASYVWEE